MAVLGCDAVLGATFLGRVAALVPALREPEVPSAARPRRRRHASVRDTGPQGGPRA
nr:hypothetical protein OG461_18940 [Streptomyces sp. NBC_00995]